MKFNYKKFFNKTNAAILIIIVIGILIVINFFSANIFYRFDLTQNKEFSLSKVSKKTVADLKDIVNIKAYFSSNLPSQYLNLKQEVGDILEEYVNYSNGNIKVEFIDPKDNEETKRELSIAGIPQLQFNVLEKDKYQVVNGYLGMQIKYGDKSQALPVIENTGNFEYQVTSAIKKLTASNLANVSFWQGNKAAAAQNETAAAIRSLSEIYQVSLLDFSKDKKISDDINTLVIAGPKEKFKDEELKALDAFLTRGGALIILADGVKVEQGLNAIKNDLGLNKILEANGLKLNNDLVLDASNGIATFNQGFISFSTNYPYWPKVVKSGFNQSNPAVAKLEGLILPWASSIDVNSDKTKNLSVSYLAKTTERALMVSDNFNLSPQAQINGAKSGQFNLAVAVTGKFTSAFNQPSVEAGKLAIVGDGDFLNDGFLRNYPDNLTFFLNVVDSLSLGDELISIRSKGVTERPIKELSETAKNALRYGNIFGLTVLVIVIGLVRYYLRRRERVIDLM